MNQKKLTILTLVVVVAGAVLINEFIIRSSMKDGSIDNNNRDVASFGERFEPERIKWEQELAKTVARESGKTLVGTKPSLNEKFLFEVLAGKYEASVVDGKILKIKVMENQTPLVLKTEDLVKNYASVFKGAISFEKSTQDSLTERLVLKDNSGQSIGNATIHRDDQGRVIDIEIQ